MATDPTATKAAQAKFPYHVDVPTYMGRMLLELLGWCRRNLLLNSYDFQPLGAPRANFYRFYFLREADAAEFRKQRFMLPGVISDRDSWQAALLMVKQYGADAMIEASFRADQLLDEGDMAGAETWHRILDAIECLLARKPAEGEAVH